MPSRGLAHSGQVPDSQGGVSGRGRQLSRDDV